MRRRVLGVVAMGVLLLVAIAFWLMWRPTIDPIEKPNADSFPAQRVELGRRVAAGGNCVICHTSDGGTPNAGGRPMQTPFGTIYSTNITPDPDTGIGTWSYAAFERAMRHGVARDGTHLYPAFPYTAFTRMHGSDMEALYAYLMVQPPQRFSPPATNLPFPFNLRPLLAGWKLLFLDTSPIATESARSEAWNRGHYLVSAVGHCSACHSPRNLLGAEKSGASYLAGGEAEGWDAPALNGASLAPIPWTDVALYDYLRHGFSIYHGAATGSMADVVRAGTSRIAESDTRAIAEYLVSFGPTGSTQNDATLASGIRAATYEQWRPAATLGARLFGGACATCHHGGEGQKMFGVRPELWLSTSLHLAKPDNLIHTILDGVQQPVHAGIGFMPPFRHALNDTQIAELANFLRTQFARKPEWPQLQQAVARMRAGRESDERSSISNTSSAPR